MALCCRVLGDDHTKFSVFLLHGFQCTADDVSEWGARLYDSLGGRAKMIMPTASKIPITAHGGEEQYSWFDYLTDSEGEREDVVCQSDIRSACARLATLINQEVRRVGRYTRVFLVGVSQGGCLALEIASKVELGGVVTVVGHRMYTSAHRALLTPWMSVRATDDEVFSASWARALQEDGAELVLEVQGGHCVEYKEFTGAVEDFLKAKLALGE